MANDLQKAFTEREAVFTAIMTGKSADAEKAWKKIKTKHKDFTKVDAHLALYFKNKNDSKSYDLALEEFGVISMSLGGI